MKRSNTRRLTIGAVIAALVVGGAAAPALAVSVDGWAGTANSQTATVGGVRTTVTFTDKVTVSQTNGIRKNPATPSASIPVATVIGGGELGLNTIGLNEAFPCKNGTECVRGQVRIDFDKPIANPRISLANLGGDQLSDFIGFPPGGNVSSSAKYTLLTPGASLTRTSGNLDVTGTTITSNDLGAKTGTVQVNGTYSSVVFQVSMRSKGAFLGIIPTWTKVPSDLHQLDVDIDPPAPVAPSLRITKTDGRNTVSPGDLLAYSMTVTNAGNGVATSAVVSDPLPAGLSFVSGSGPAGTTVTAAGQQVTASLGNLAPGQSTTFIVNARVASTVPPGTLKNEACVAAANAAKVCASDTDNVLRPLLQYTFNYRPTDPNPGDVVTYRMELTNAGNLDSPRTEMVYDVSSVLDDATWNPASVTASTGAASVTGTTIAWTGPLAVGSTAVVTFTAVWKGTGDSLTFPDVRYYGPAR